MLQLMQRKKSSLHLELISLTFLPHCEEDVVATVDPGHQDLSAGGVETH